MILIADAGGTSINWRMIAGNGKISQAKTSGYNAYAHPVEKFRDSLKDLKSQLPNEHISKIFFYGAGLLSSENKMTVYNELKAYFNVETCEVNHDLLAAARSLLGNESGIACILGTGSNSCYYDGEKIIENKPSLGYILGDEGSGNALGKELLRIYFRGGLPDDLKVKFENRYQIGVEELLKNVYTEKKGPGYLAEFTGFLFHNMRQPFVYQLIYQEFEKFFTQIINQYDNPDEKVVNFCGGIAFYYANILRQVGNDKGIAIKTIVENPIAGLTLYHQNKDL